MLEVVDVSAGVDGHIIIFMEYGQQALLHVEALALLLRGVGIDGMMAHYNHPVFLGILQDPVEPGELSLHVLLAGIGIFG